MISSFSSWRTFTKMEFRTCLCQSHIYKVADKFIIDRTTTWKNVLTRMGLYLRVCRVVYMCGLSKRLNAHWRTDNHINLRCAYGESYWSIILDIFLDMNNICIFVDFRTTAWVFHSSTSVISQGESLKTYKWTFHASPWENSQLSMCLLIDKIYNLFKLKIVL